MEIDYTEIRNDSIRGEICHYMSEMLDNPDEYGIYPTSKFMWEMETLVLRYKEDYERACQTMADMHAAAMGCVQGFNRGPVEDVADLRAEVERLRSKKAECFLCKKTISSEDIFIFPGYDEDLCWECAEKGPQGYFDKGDG